MITLSSMLALLRANATLAVSQALNKEIILNYQMGKAASTSIQDAITSAGSPASFHIHRLNPVRTEQIKCRYDAGEHYYRDMRLEQRLFRFLKSGDHPVKIICPIREPFSQSYSAFFQNLARSTRGQHTEQTATVSNLRDIFLNWEELGQAVTWIDDEISEVIGLDLYSRDFDKHRGWEIFEHGRYSILILKSEIGDKEKSEAVSSFLGIMNLRVSEANTADVKPYRSLYNDFKNSVKIPRKTASAWVSSKYMKKFYTDDETKLAFNHFAEAAIL